MKRFPTRHCLGAIKTLPLLLAVIVVVASAWRPATAAEIQLLAQAHVKQNIVRLADVAIVLDRDSQLAGRLEETPLLAAPQPGDRTALRASEIRDMLQTRGVNLVGHQFSGASRTVVTREEQDTESPRQTGKPINSTEQTEQIRAAVVSYLRRRAEDTDRWEVDFRLDREQRGQLASADSSIQVRGGTSPWIGEQRFSLVFTSAGDSREISIDTVVSKPTMQVVAVRPLRRGQVVQASDVVLQLPDTDKQPRQGAQQASYTSLDEVVGMEMQRSVTPGQALASGSVRRPLLVRRGDVVTVYARSAGIEVRTVARAKDDGAENDLVVVESLDRDRRPIRARVTDIRTVDVLAEGSYATRGSRRKIENSPR